jgi:tRNA-splicing ligase RtcB
VRQARLGTPTLKQVSEWIWELPATGGMRVPGRVYADRTLAKALEQDQSLTQVANVAHLPGIVGYSLAMPDIHFGYGFPIGGVAAFTVNEGVVSPGGVGYDINCGCRLLATDLEAQDIGDQIRRLVDQLFRDVPSGVGASGAIAKLSRRQLQDLLVKGAAWAVEQGYGSARDLEHTEDGGARTRWAPWARGTIFWRSRWWTRSSTGKRPRPTVCARVW